MHSRILTIKQIPYRSLYEKVVANFSADLLPTIVEEQIREWALLPEVWMKLDDFVLGTRGDALGEYPLIQLDPDLIQNTDSDIYQSRSEVERYMHEHKRIYGVNTGFGSARKFVLSTENSGHLSVNILLSHATAVGKPLPVEVVRGMMILRLKTFAQGFSGVSMPVIQKLQEMLNAGIVPFIPEKGSVGSSGDLSPLAHLFLVMIGRGKAWVVKNANQLVSTTSLQSDQSITFVDERFDSRAMSIHSDTIGMSPSAIQGFYEKHPLALYRGEEAWKIVGISPLPEQQLSMKDGLAMSNGATAAAAILALASFDALQLYHTANITGAFSLSAVSGHSRAFEPIAQIVRPQIGQLVTSASMMKLLEGNNFVNRIGYEGDAQDDYSIRGIPQVHGAVWDTIEHARKVIEIEINSATDNPLFFASILKNGTSSFLHPDKHFDTDYSETLGTTHCSAANFHGEPIAIAADALKIAVSELSSISERRIQLLLDEHHNRGLPSNLTLGGSGLHSGMMIFQYTAASIVSENKVLCHPSSVDSIPTSANAEDHVSMATNAARHCRVVIQNTTDVLAIELVCGLQAIDIRSSAAMIWMKTHRNRQNKNQTLSELLNEWFGENYSNRAKVFFPELVSKSLENSDLKFNESLFDTSSLTLGKKMEKIRSYLRNHQVYPVPFILHDGYGWDEQIQPEDWMKTFLEVEPATLIWNATHFIHNRILTNLSAVIN